MSSLNDVNVTASADVLSTVTLNVNDPPGSGRDNGSAVFVTDTDSAASRLSKVHSTFCEMVSGMLTVVSPASKSPSVPMSTSVPPVHVMFSSDHPAGRLTSETVYVSSAGSALNVRVFDSVASA